MAVPEHVGHCGQREEVGRVLRRAAQQSSTTLSIQRADARRDVLWNGRWYSEETGRSEVESPGTQAEVEPRTKLPRVCFTDIGKLLSEQRIESGQPYFSAP